MIKQVYIQAFILYSRAYIKIQKLCYSKIYSYFYSVSSNNKNVTQSYLENTVNINTQCFYFLFYHKATTVFQWFYFINTYEKMGFYSGL